MECRLIFFWGTRKQLRLTHIEKNTDMLWEKLIKQLCAEASEFEKTIKEKKKLKMRIGVTNILLKEEGELI